MTDSVTGQVMACTVTIRTPDGHIVTENPGFTGGFRCSGVFDKSVPPGRTEITVRRGFDYGAVTRTVLLQPDNTVGLTFELARRTPLRRLGWICGDNHNHMIHGERTISSNFDYVALAGRAEALDYMSVAQQWNLPEATPEILDAAVRQVSGPDFRLFWNMEARNYWQGDASHCMGHGWTLGMGGRTADGASAIDEIYAMNAHDTEREKTPTPNFDTQALVHQLGGIISYTHPTRWWRGRWGGENGFPVEENKFLSNMAQELPFDTVAGPTYDGLDILMPVNERETNETTQRLWFELLNHGYRIPATASSDSTFDRPGGALPGVVRVYTHVDGELTAAGVAAALKAGRNFVTSGPLLLFRMGDHQPGDVVHLKGAAKLPVSVQAWSSGEPGEYLTKVELIRNGAVVRNLPVSGSATTFETTFNVEETGTGWYIVRCTGSGEKQIAISNPVYFEGSDYHAPEPAEAQLDVSVLDEASGEPLNGTYEVLRMVGRKAVIQTSSSFRDGALKLSVPATVRLRISAAGHLAVTKSVFMDTPELLDMAVHMSRDQLIDWRTFERIRALLGNVHMEIRLPRQITGRQPRVRHYAPASATEGSRAPGGRARAGCRLRATSGTG